MAYTSPTNANVIDANGIIVNDICHYTILRQTPKGKVLKVLKVVETSTFLLPVLALELDNTTSMRSI